MSALMDEIKVGDSAKEGELDAISSVVFSIKEVRLQTISEQER